MCVYMCVCEMKQYPWTGCVLHRKWQKSTSCSDGNLICGVSCPGCYHTQTHANAHKLEHKHMEGQTHTHTHTQSADHHPVYFSLSCIVTWAYSKYKLFVLSPALLRGLFLCVCVYLCVCVCSFHQPITAVLLINAVLTVWYQVKGLWVWIIHYIQLLMSLPSYLYVFKEFPTF